MTWTYSGDPSTDAKDATRFYLGDTVSTDPLVQDEELLFLLESYTPLQAAAIAARSLCARFTREASSKSVGDLSISRARAKEYCDLAAKLAADAGGGGMLASAAVPTVYAGGTRRSDMDVDEKDLDRVEPAFKVGMHSDPRRNDRVRSPSVPD